jgi:hypothetical protein
MRFVLTHNVAVSTPAVYDASRNKGGCLCCVLHSASERDRVGRNRVLVTDFQPDPLSPTQQIYDTFGGDTGAFGENSGPPSSPPDLRDLRRVPGRKVALNRIASFVHHPLARRESTRTADVHRIIFGYLAGVGEGFGSVHEQAFAKPLRAVLARERSGGEHNAIALKLRLIRKVLLGVGQNRPDAVRRFRRDDEQTQAKQIIRCAQIRELRPLHRALFFHCLSFASNRRQRAAAAAHSQATLRAISAQASLRCAQVSFRIGDLGPRPMHAQDLRTRHGVESMSRPRPAELSAVGTDFAVTRRGASS